MRSSERYVAEWSRSKYGPALAAAALLIGVAGCGHPLESGFSDQGKAQLQFYSPPGATVEIMAGPTRAHQIAQYGPFGNRLEQSPEEFCVFNLSPGRYEFKYTSADGLPGVSVYGEIEVHGVCTHEARVFCRRAFIPIALPSDYYRRVEANGDEIVPYRAEAYRYAIDEMDLERLKQGDVIEKVFVVADLQKAERVRNDTQTKIAVCEKELEYANQRYQLAYHDYRIDVSDRSANFWGTDRAFIKWEAKRQETTQKLARLEAKLTRTNALLKGDHVLVRRGMMVLATEEVVEAHKDVEDAADELGEILLVMRIGGRHMQWGDPRREMMAYQQ